MFVNVFTSAKHECRRWLSSPSGELQPARTQSGFIAGGTSIPQSSQIRAMAQDRSSSATGPVKFTGIVQCLSKHHQLYTIIKPFLAMAPLLKMFRVVSCACTGQFCHFGLFLIYYKRLPWINMRWNPFYKCTMDDKVI